jgi:hypothetical protein
MVNTKNEEFGRVQIAIVKGFAVGEVFTMGYLRELTGINFYLLKQALSDLTAQGYIESMVSRNGRTYYRKIKG